MYTSVCNRPTTSQVSSPSSVSQLQTELADSAEEAKALEKEKEKEKDISKVETDADDQTDIPGTSGLTALQAHGSESRLSGGNYSYSESATEERSFEDASREFREENAPKERSEVSNAIHSVAKRLSKARDFLRGPIAAFVVKTKNESAALVEKGTKQILATLPPLPKRKKKKKPAPPPPVEVRCNPQIPPRPILDHILAGISSTEEGVWQKLEHVKYIDEEVTTEDSTDYTDVDWGQVLNNESGEEDIIYYTYVVEAPNEKVVFYQRVRYSEIYSSSESEDESELSHFAVVENMDIELEPVQRLAGSPTKTVSEPDIGLHDRTISPETGLHDRTVSSDTGLHERTISSEIGLHDRTISSEIDKDASFEVNNEFPVISDQSLDSVPEEETLQVEVTAINQVECTSPPTKPPRGRSLHDRPTSPFEKSEQLRSESRSEEHKSVPEYAAVQRGPPPPPPPELRLTRQQDVPSSPLQLNEGYYDLDVQPSPLPRRKTKPVRPPLPAKKPQMKPPVPPKTYMSLKFPVVKNVKEVERSEEAKESQPAKPETPVERIQVEIRVEDIEDNNVEGAKSNDAELVNGLPEADRESVVNPSVTDTLVDDASERRSNWADSELSEDKHFWDTRSISIPPSITSESGFMSSPTPPPRYRKKRFRSVDTPEREYPDTENGSRRSKSCSEADIVKRRALVEISSTPSTSRKSTLTRDASTNTRPSRPPKPALKPKPVRPPKPASLTRKLALAKERDKRKEFKSVEQQTSAPPSCEGSPVLGGIRERPLPPPPAPPRHRHPVRPTENASPFPNPSPLPSPSSLPTITTTTTTTTIPVELFAKLTELEGGRINLSELNVQKINVAALEATTIRVGNLEVVNLIPKEDTSDTKKNEDGVVAGASDKHDKTTDKPVEHLEEVVQNEGYLGTLVTVGELTINNNNTMEPLVQVEPVVQVNEERVLGVDDNQEAQLVNIEVLLSPNEANQNNLNFVEEQVKTVEEELSVKSETVVIEAELHLVSEGGPPTSETITDVQDLPINESELKGPLPGTTLIDKEGNIVVVESEEKEKKEETPPPPDVPESKNNKKDDDDDEKGGGGGGGGRGPERGNGDGGDNENADDDSEPPKWWKEAVPPPEDSSQPPPDSTMTGKICGIAGEGVSKRPIEEKTTPVITGSEKMGSAIFYTNENTANSNRELSPTPSQKSNSSGSSSGEKKKKERKASKSSWYDEGEGSGQSGDIDTSDGKADGDDDNLKTSTRDSYSASVNDSDVEGVSQVRRHIASLFTPFGSRDRKKGQRFDRSSQFYMREGSPSSSSNTDAEHEDIKKVYPSRTRSLSNGLHPSLKEQFEPQYNKPDPNANYYENEAINESNFEEKPSSQVLETKANITKIKTSESQPMIPRCVVEETGKETISNLQNHNTSPKVVLRSKSNPGPSFPDSQCRCTASSLTSIPTSEDSWCNCTSGDESDSEATFLTSQSCLEDQLLSDNSEHRSSKRFCIAEELMSSERVFVDVLKLLNEDFREHVVQANGRNGQKIIPDSALEPILRYLPQLQNLNQDLLKDLTNRIQNWNEIGRIADVIVKKGPFLKLYSAYIKDFESITAALDEACRKFPGFSQVVKDFEGSDRCKKLALKHYMLKPVQRIPQYKLLLEDYLKHLTVDSSDYEDTITALRIVTDVANHANQTMKQGDNFSKLLQIQNLMGRYEIIRPGRLFIKEGELKKLSRKIMQPRWFILFNDSLLHTDVQQGSYRLHHELPLAGMKVTQPTHEEYQNEFSIISVTRSFILSASTIEERKEWIEALERAIEANAARRGTFISASDRHKVPEKEPHPFVLGKAAPVWTPDARVTMCQICTCEFTITFRRHHCRACGRVVCGSCSDNVAPLQYLNYGVKRVCDDCYARLSEEFDASENTRSESDVSTECVSEGKETHSDGSGTSLRAVLRAQFKRGGGLKKQTRQLPRVLKEVRANNPDVTISGYLNKRVKKSWKQFWFVIHDKVLYTYKASEDVAALESIPLLSFQVSKSKKEWEGIDPNLVFQLVHTGHTAIVFHAENKASAEKWIKAMQSATVLEDPPIKSMDS